MLEISEVMMGKEHPITLASIGNLAISYSDLGSMYKVAGLEKKVLEVSQRIRSEEYPNTLEYSIDLGGSSDVYDILAEGQLPKQSA